PTITWWDASNYSHAAATLGLTSPPGSLLLTLIGYPLTRLPLDLPAARVLNLLAGVIAALTIGLVFVVARRVTRMAAADAAAAGGRGALTGSALGALAVAFAATQWEHAIKFTPYILTALFTGLILTVMLRWWEAAEHPDAWRWLLVMGLLFGLDLSVHRTNALLLPSALAWILIRQPSTLARARSWIAGTAGLVAGLAVHLLVIPLARYTSSSLNMYEPTTWRTFWDYLSLESRGGGFLVKLWPRNANLLGVQVADFVQVFGDNLAHASSSLGVLGWLPLVAALTGWVVLRARAQRLAVALAAVIGLHAVTTIAYFNIPADYFRPMDRHYLPVVVIVGMLVAVGTGWAGEWVAQRRREGRRWAAASAAVVIGLVPLVQLASQWTAHDASRRYFTRDFAANALEGLPPNAIYFTVGDNDTFPLWYLQDVEGVRPDVTVINMSLLNTPWYVAQHTRRDPTFPISRVAVLTDTTAVDSVVTVPITQDAGHFALPTGSVLPGTFIGRPRPTYGTAFSPADRALVDMVRTNAWRRPLTFAVTGAEGVLSWLTRHARLEGLHWRIVPVDTPATDAEALRQRLLTAYRYRGYADSSVLMDPVSRNIGQLYTSSVMAMLTASRSAGAVARCRAARTAYLDAMPPARTGLDPERQAALAGACE
ncbi:MAG: DUF2723 domain-containing protein, partial [Gemmatimonadetes bacterium]|nr:DUF2723 domain-containing protein [Gemmatimonadota bacterium]